jgi:transposase
MRNVREVLRLKFEQQLTNRKIAQSLGISHTVVNDYIRRAEKADLSWPLPENYDDETLEQRLSVQEQTLAKNHKPMLPLEYIYQELKKKGVTLQLLWHEYKEIYPDGYQYSWFCDLYRTWAKTLDVTLRQEHRAGEKLFVDFAGQTMPIYDPHSGTVFEAQIFIACLGASNYTFAYATLSQNLTDWITAHVKAFEFFGGVTEIVVPDNLKAGVKSPCRYEPEINPTYQELADHYGFAVIPARSRHPRDKAKVESAVLIAERWILAALRNHTFFSLAQLNNAIAQKLTELNKREFQKLDTCRLELFETLDKPTLKPLSEHRYEIGFWKKATVNIDYHIEVDRHYYSVPYQLVGKKVDVRLSAHTVEILFKNKRVASHRRSRRKGGFTTVPAHMPDRHQKYLEWTPSRIIKWASETGTNTKELVSQILTSRAHPQQGYRACLGIMRLGKRYSPERLEAACARALAIRAYSLKSVKSILKTGLDQQPLLTNQSELQLVPLTHHNVRGSHYYHQEDPDAQ